MHAEVGGASTHVHRTHARTHARTQSGRVVCFRSEEHAEPGLVVMSPQGWAYVQADCKGKPRGDGFMQIEQVTVRERARMREGVRV